MTDVVNEAVATNESEALEISVSLLRLLDGTLIDPLTREPMNIITKETKTTDTYDKDDEIEDLADYDPSELDIVAVDRKSIMDLQLSTDQMAVVNNILVYTLWGLPDDEIAMACNCKTEDVAAVRLLDEYDSMQGALTTGLYNAVSATVQGKITLASLTAVDRIRELMSSKSADVRLSASSNLLDRAGHRAADRVEHTHSFGKDAELTIRVTHDSDKDKIPTLNLKSVN